MGDARPDYQQISRESIRYDTYDEQMSESMRNKLARAGFYNTRNQKNVKCFSCDFEFDITILDENADLIKFHLEKKPDCRFAKNQSQNLNARSKKFLSYDSLRFEKERLETFIEWPLPWLSPEALASDGFYFLRTHDHCACVFCRGIVGAWEVGDTPRGEHQRHFPHCPFIRGQPVGNVPMSHSIILDRLPLDGEECPIPPPRCELTVDEAGSSSGTGRHMPGSYPECKGPQKKNLNFDNIGLPKYSGPKRKDYVTKESRLKSFSRWPERVVQKPEEMAEAGFFYCGLSDHVRCFHCGSGLRNWEIDDKPWEEHARWYPDCSYVLLSKGQEFIDKVRRERPPYLRTAASKDGKPQEVAVSSGQFKPIKESDLDPLMRLDIMQAVSGMGFPPETIRKALRRKLEQTGLPFFSLEPCIEAVLQLMEEETRQALQENNIQVESEAMERQNDKMQALSSQSSNAPLQTVVVAGPSRYENASQPALTSASMSASTSTSSTSVTTSSAASAASAAVAVIPSSDVSSVPNQETPSQSNIENEAMEVDEPSESMESQPSEVVVEPTVSESQTLDLPHMLREAEEAMNAADKALKPSLSGPSSLEGKTEGSSPCGETLAEKSNDNNPTSSLASPDQARSEKNIAEELERIRESRTCKICMDAEMNVVFLPCTHMATCSSCAVTMATCPICRVDIKYTIKPIFS